MLSFVTMKDLIRVLFVEDDPEMMEIYTENFLLPEFEVATAVDGEKAMELLRNSDKKFDVIVTDNNMPNLDGMRLLKMIHKEFPDLKVLMVTGFGNWSDYVDAHNMGVHKFIDKPVKMIELKTLIRAIA